MINEELRKYKEYLKIESKKFKLTEEDLGNLYDLFFIIDTPKEINQDFMGTLKLNHLDKWFHNFHERIEKIVIPELNNKKDIRNK